MGVFGCPSWRNDPGPCPVDDTPHTACTAESVGLLTITSRRPRTLDKTIKVQPARGPEFTTSTYRRAVHGRKRKP